MRRFKGPLGHYKTYIEEIALPNCEDYFNLVEILDKKKDKKTPDHWKELRLYLNAAESLNNILEYKYIDSLESIKDYSPKELYDFKQKLYNEHKFLQEVSDVSNAYKHRIRVNSGSINNKKRHAKDYMNAEFKCSIDFERSGEISVGVKYVYENLIDRSIIKKACNFWIKDLK